GGELSGSGNVYTTSMVQRPLVELKDYFEGLGGFLEQVGQDPYSVGFDFHFVMTDFDNWASHYVPLEEAVPGLSMKGPLQADVRIEPGERGQELFLAVTVPAETICFWANEDETTKRVFWDKPAGSAMAFELTGKINPEEKTAEDLKLICHSGTESIISGSGELKWTEGFDWELYNQVAVILPAEDVTGRLKFLPIEAFEGEWQVGGIGNWLAVFPDIAGQLESLGIALGGGVFGEIGFEKEAGVRLEARGKVDFAGLKLQIGSPEGVGIISSDEGIRSSDFIPINRDSEASGASGDGYFSKAVGMASELVFEVGEDLLSHEIDYRVQGRVENGGLSIEAKGRAERLVGVDTELSFIRQRQW
ncbi:MAG: hypothetical protein GY869_09425, partial [Planctomycetes bacterium]|nr:hypothetical protein [Planctomycetota bacterium]